MGGMRIFTAGNKDEYGNSSESDWCGFGGASGV